MPFLFLGTLLVYFDASTLNAGPSLERVFLSG